MKGFLREFQIGDCVNHRDGDYLGRIHAIDPYSVKIRMFNPNHGKFLIYKKHEIVHAH